jgi:hypothetical protein
MEVKPAEFARLAGVSRQSIGGKIKNKSLIINTGGMLDTENPVNAAYISRHGRGGGMGYPAAAFSPEQSAGAGGAVGAAPSLPIVWNGTENDLVMAKAAGVPAELLGLTLRELVVKYGGNLLNLEKHAKVLRDLTMASEKEQRIQERRLALIEKDFVTSRLFQFVDVLMKQLLEYPDAISASLVAVALSKGQGARADVTAKMKEGIEKIISGAKNQIIAELNGLRTKYQGGEDKIENMISDIEEAGIE